MKLLLDSCIWGGSKKILMDRGYDVEWSGDWDSDPGDQEILSYAYHEGRILITLDKDFGELAVFHNQPHSGIIRLVNLAAKNQAKVCIYILSHYYEDLLNSAIITAESNRIRIRY